MQHPHPTYWQVLWKHFSQHRLGMAAFYVWILFCLVGIYAPFLASSKPLFVVYEGQFYFPLFRYLLYTGFYTKRLDIFFNLMIFSFPLLILFLFFLKKTGKIRWMAALAVAALQIILFVYFAYKQPVDPATDPKLNQQRAQYVQAQLEKDRSLLPDWNFDLAHKNAYAKLNLVLNDWEGQRHHQRLLKYYPAYAESVEKKWHAQAAQKTLPEELTAKLSMPDLWQMEQNQRDDEIQTLKKNVQELEKEGKQNSSAYEYAQAQLNYIQQKQEWLKTHVAQLRFVVMPLLRPFHWEDDAGGSQSLNQYVGWWELTRINRKDLAAALIFGVRISLVVGICAVALALLIGIPVGAFAGYYGGLSDIIVSRLLEIWESMPTFFMLLLVVAVTQSKSIFLIIAVIGIFGWTGISRYIRGEFFKQRNLPYVEACHALGFRDSYIMFSHILPNAIPPVLTLLPFAVMGAISSEAGLSFLGLGEEGSCSWGVLMDEGRTAFPGESYLLWPPAILLTILLVAIALVGDALRDSLDPKLRATGP